MSKTRSFLDVNVILQTFRILDHIRYELFRPFLNVSKGLKKVENTHKTVRIRERLGTFEPERTNALESKVENVHVCASKTKELFWENWEHNVF